MTTFDVRTKRIQNEESETCPACCAEPGEYHRGDCGEALCPDHHTASRQCGCHEARHLDDLGLTIAIMTVGEAIDSLCRLHGIESEGADGHAALASTSSELQEIVDELSDLDRSDFLGDARQRREISGHTMQLIKACLDEQPTEVDPGELKAHQDFLAHLESDDD